MSQLCMNDFKDIEELRKSLFAYVQEYNQRISFIIEWKITDGTLLSESTLIIRMSDQEGNAAFYLKSNVKYLMTV